MTIDLQLRERVAILERTLSLSLDILQTVLDRLETKFGDDFFVQQSKSALAIQAEMDAQQAIDKFDELIKGGERVFATRAFRSEFDLTWDQTHVLINHWSVYSRGQKVRIWRLTKWMKSVSSRSA